MCNDLLSSLLMVVVKLSEALPPDSSFKLHVFFLPHKDQQQVF